MKVKDILKEKSQELITIHTEASVKDAAIKMFQRNIGALFVEEGGEIVGLISERDVVRVMSEPEIEKKVRDIMVPSDKMVVAEPEDDVEYVMAVMNQNNIRHIPIVEKGKIIGIISIRDVVKVNVKKLKAEIHYLKEYISQGY